MSAIMSWRESGLRVSPCQVRSIQETSFRRCQTVTSAGVMFSAFWGTCVWMVCQGGVWCQKCSSGRHTSSHQPAFVVLQAVLHTCSRLLAMMIGVVHKSDKQCVNARQWLKVSTKLTSCIPKRLWVLVSYQQCVQSVQETLPVRRKICMHAACRNRCLLLLKSGVFA